jgi:uncharacterized protein (TIGR03067 family)
MRTKLAVIAVLALCLGAKVDDAKKDKDKVQGEWTMASGERDGNEIPEEFVKSLKRVMKGDTFEVTREGETLAKGTFTLNESKTPKTIDLKLEGTDEPVHGIYEMADDTLKICYASPGAERPKEFSAKSGSGCTLAVWKRVKK